MTRGAVPVVLNSQETEDGSDHGLPFGDFFEAASAVLKLLHKSVGMGLWMVTRTEGNDWIVLIAEDHGYGVQAGDVFEWSDSFCSRMVQGLGPRVAPNSASISEYVAAPIGQQVNIGAYVGVPITQPDGTLFGTLCAIDPLPQPESLTEHLSTVEMHARLLSTILLSEVESQNLNRALQFTAAASETDPLTGLHNRRGWERLCEREEARCLRYGDPAGILVIDLDDFKQINDDHGHDAGDKVLKRAAEALLATVRKSDVVARLGGDEFAVLAVNATVGMTRHLADRIAAAFDAAGVRASIGWASRNPRKNLNAALTAADQVMYQEKRLNKGAEARP